MNKNNKLVKKIFYITTPSLVVGSLAGVGFSSFILGEDQSETTNINIETGNLEMVSSVYFNNISMLSRNINFDAFDLDNFGKVTSTNSSEQLTIRFTGTLNGYNTNWDEIRFNIRISNEFKYVFEQLIDDKLIEEPIFHPLKKGSSNKSITTNEIGSFWTSDATSNDTRNFVVYAEFNWGEYFNNMNPSLFFDSNNSNGIKKGNEYTTNEIREILDRIKELDNADYTIYIDPFIKSETNYSVTLDANGGSFEFNNTNFTTKLFDNLIDHDKIILPVPFYSRNSFLYWKNESTGETFAGNERIYIDEIFKNNSQKSLVLKAFWRNIEANGTVEFNTNSESMPSNLTVYVKSKSETSTYYDFNNNVGGTIHALIGDKIRISNSNGVKEIFFEGLSAQPDLYGFYEVINSNFTITITPRRAFYINIAYNTISGEAVSPEYVMFSLVKDKGETSIYKQSETNQIQVGEGEEFLLNNIHGVDSIIYNGNDINNSDNYISVTENINITITPQNSLTVTLNKVNIDNGKTPNVNYTVNNSSGVEICNLNTGDISGSSVTIKNKLAIGDNITFNVDASTNVNKISPDEIFNIQEDASVSVTPTEGGGCFTKGTLILMGDNTYKKIEDLKVGDIIKTYSHNNGCFENQPLTYISYHSTRIYKVLKLTFEDNVSINVLFAHGFLNANTKKYEEIGYDNVKNKIGNEYIFAENNKLVRKTLVFYEIYEEETECYSLTSAYNLNHIINGALSISDDISGLYNYFELDDNFNYDKEKQKADLLKYGLLEYDKVSYFIPKIIYDLFNAKYLNVSIGKGLITIETMEKYVRTFFNNEIIDNLAMSFLI